MNKAVFLDRDGVINKVKLVNGLPTPPSTAMEVEILSGVAEAIQLLKQSNFIPVVVTNQPDVARGRISKSQVNTINSIIGQELGLEYFYICFHDDTDNCDCRKPAPGLIKRAADELDLDPKQSFVVGDRWKDITAGQLAGCQTFFIDYLYPEQKPKAPFTRVTSLIQAVHLILGDEYGAL
jgi:D-glycero-D-manno-heptose 1,7-bisphosphate phosphatase